MKRRGVKVKPVSLTTLRARYRALDHATTYLPFKERLVLWKMRDEVGRGYKLLGGKGWLS